MNDKSRSDRGRELMTEGDELHKVDSHCLLMIT